MDRLKQLKAILRENLRDTLKNLWDTEEDKKYLETIITELAKYAIMYKDASTADELEEAAFNLDMLQLNLVGYFHQKGIIAERSAEALAKKIVAFFVEIIKRLI